MRGRFIFSLLTLATRYSSLATFSPPGRLTEAFYVGLNFLARKEKFQYNFNMKYPFNQGLTLRLFFLAAAVGVITFLHYSTSPYLLFYHEILIRLYYLPIILAAFWFGLRGGLISSILISLLYAPHVVFQLAEVLPREKGPFLEIILYNVVGAVTGVMAQRIQDQKERFQRTATELQKLHQELEQQTSLLLEKEEMLRRADRLSALGELSAGIAHEIRNPLASIKGTAEILQEDFPAASKKFEFLQILIRETERLNKVVENFLSFARPKIPDLGSCEVSAVLKSVLELVKHPASKGQVTIKTNFDGQGPDLIADAEQLKQAFLNIILNALQAMPQGGELSIVTRHQAPWVEIYFQDQGAGIPPHDLDKIFNPFYTTKGEGTGLGLAITHRIIAENHGGQMEVESEEGKGTKFIVRLPMKK